MFQGLRTVVYFVPDVAAAKAWYSKAFEATPYFDTPFYVGFSIGGYELGLHPDEKGATFGDNAVAYWGVPKIEEAMTHMAKCGAVTHSEPTDVGEGIKVASVADPWGNIIGIIENPHFRASSATNGDRTRPDLVGRPRRSHRLSAWRSASGARRTE